jgi:hypothetical protein
MRNLHFGFGRFFLITPTRLTVIQTGLPEIADQRREPFGI